MDCNKSENDKQELTSTMGNILSTSKKEEKNDTSDATPTSSTDANTSSSASQIVSDDPISSTSSDVVEQKKMKETLQAPSVVEEKTPEMMNVFEVGNKSAIEDQEPDLLEISMSNAPREKITEDVEDLVQDLENLLGESTDAFNIPPKGSATAELGATGSSPVATTVQDVVSEDLPTATAVQDTVVGQSVNLKKEELEEGNCIVINDTSNNDEVTITKISEDKIEEDTQTSNNVTKTELVDSTLLQNSVEPLELEESEAVDNIQLQTQEVIPSEVLVTSEVGNEAPVVVVPESEHIIETLPVAEEKADISMKAETEVLESVESQAVVAVPEVGTLDAQETRIEDVEMAATAPENVESQSENVVEATVKIVEQAVTETAAEIQSEIIPESITESVAEIVTETAEVLTGNDVSTIVAEIAHKSIENVTEIVPEIVKEPVEVVQEPAEVVHETAEVVQEIAEVVQETAEIVQEPAEVVQEPAEIASETAETPPVIEEIPMETEIVPAIIAENADESDVEFVSETPPDIAEESIVEKASETPASLATELQDVAERLHEITNQDIEMKNEPTMEIPNKLIEQTLAESVQEIVEEIKLDEKININLQKKDEDSCAVEAVVESEVLEASLKVAEQIPQVEAMCTESEPMDISDDVEVIEVPQVITNDEFVEKPKEEADHPNDQKETQVLVVEKLPENLPEQMDTEDNEASAVLAELLKDNDNEEKYIEEEEKIEPEELVPLLTENFPVENNCDLLAHTSESIPDVSSDPPRAELVPEESKLAEYETDEVERAFGIDMPLDIVQKPEEAIQQLPTQIYQENIEAENRELDTLRQAVASIMDAQDEPQQLPEINVEVPQVAFKEKSITVTRSEIIDKVVESKLEEPLMITIEEPDKEKEKIYSPKVTIKPIIRPPDEDVSTTSNESEQGKGSLKMTITKQSDTMHSILKIYNPEDPVEYDSKDPEHEQTIPKLIIKPKMQQVEQQHSPKISTRSSKQYHSPTSSSQRSGSPRITIKPVVKPPESKTEVVSPLKITIKPVMRPEELARQKHSPKLTIKPIEEIKHSPKLTIKPITKPSEEEHKVASPRVTIKPIVKPVDEIEQVHSPRITIKPIPKPMEEEAPVSPKITIKPVVKPPEPDTQSYEEEEVKERIVLKINKGNLPTPSKEKKREHVEDDKSEKLAKIKLKFSKEGGQHTVQPVEENKRKRLNEDVSPEPKSKKQKSEHVPSPTIDNNELKGSFDDSENESRLPQILNVSSPIVISEDSTQDSGSVIIVEDLKDPLADIPVFEMTSDSAMCSNITISPIPVPIVTPPMPRKRGRPRKVPLEVREEFKDIKEEIPQKQEEPPPPPVESGRPKRSCRGQNVRDTLGIKPRKPRGPGRGRGSKRGMGTRTIPMKPEKEPKLSKAKLKLLQQSVEDQIPKAFQLDKVQTDLSSGVIDVDLKSPAGSLLFAQPSLSVSEASSTAASSSVDTADIVMFEEETRMSADTNSRAQTPAKQVVVTSGEIEESQSSVQSTATTESGRTSARPNKAPRLEVQEPEGAVISADQLAEYYWGGNGPFMLQEQVAQFLGIKSFKRKYPGITRRFVDMQERDFIRESGLASEAMCDLGLTAVNSADILDIMYSDFQDKYEEYCKHQRDRQAKDLTNKQKALSLAASQEKTKMDITEQAVQSAASWNINFNKARKEQRKACMDLQTLTVHYPKGKIKQISKPKIGNYPVALVPGQFTDFYKEFTPTEINNLPLNTLCYDTINKIPPDESEESDDGSDSDSDGSSSSSDSSDSSSGVEDCKLCKPTPAKRIATAK